MSVMNAKQTLEVLETLPVEESILIAGNHGTGKSQIVKQAAKNLGIPCIDFRLSQNDVGDLKGMPFHVRGRTIFAPPEFMPLMEADAVQLKDFLGLTEDVAMGKYGDSGILFLDEINRANREVQQAAFELVLDRRLNLRSLPPGWRVVAAINDDDDIYNVNSMEPAFLSRFFLINFKPTQQEWFAWARENNIHEAVIQFLTKMPEFLDPTKELLKEASKKGVTKVHDRRAWHKFSNTLVKFQNDHKEGKRKTDPLSKDNEAQDYLILLAGGFVGHIASIKFHAFIKSDYQALDANIILNKFNDDVQTKLQDIVDRGGIPELAAYNDLILAYIAKHTKDNLLDKQSINLSKYIKILPRELIGDFWTKFVQEQSTISTNWYQARKENQDLIVSALVNPAKKAKKTA